MKLEQRINAFIKLGEFIGKCASGCGEKHIDEFNRLIKTAYQHNSWFTEDNVRFAISSIAGMLKEDMLYKWIGKYRHFQSFQSPITNHQSPIKRIGVVMAGNIPLVGFHDMLCVLMSGNVFVGKTSSKDGRLLQKIAEVLVGIEPSFKEYIEFSESPLENINAIIATGSNNTSKYFDYYFGKYPNIIRKNRNSIAVLNGAETQDELRYLGRDIFQYFGLGCRNVSKLFVPSGYNFDEFFDAIAHNRNIIDHNKYFNNYSYNQAIFLMNKTPHLDNGFLLLKEENALASPVAAVFFEYYFDEEKLIKRLEPDFDKIQCIVSKNGIIKNSIPFGTTQQPELWDYADGVDTMKFLIKLNR